MAKVQIGFSQPAPENPDETWEKQINGWTLIFTKSRDKGGVFLYHCACHSEDDATQTRPGWGFQSHVDLSRDQVEQLPQFASFIASFSGRE